MTVPATQVDQRIGLIRALDDRTAALRVEMAEVADARADIVRRLVADGVRPAEIARALGVTRQAINHLIRRPVDQG